MADGFAPTVEIIRAPPKPDIILEEDVVTFIIKEDQVQRIGEDVLIRIKLSELKLALGL